MTYIVDQILPCEDRGEPNIAVRVYYEPKDCKILLGKEYTVVDGNIKDITSWYNSLADKNEQFKLDREKLRQSMVCKAEGHTLCTCEHQ